MISEDGGEEDDNHKTSPEVTQKNTSVAKANASDDDSSESSNREDKGKFPSKPPLLDIGDYNHAALRMEHGHDFIPQDGPCFNLRCFDPKCPSNKMSKTISNWPKKHREAIFKKGFPRWNSDSFWAIKDAQKKKILKNAIIRHVALHLAMERFYDMASDHRGLPPFVFNLKDKICEEYRSIMGKIAVPELTNPRIYERMFDKSQIIQEEE